MNITTIPFHHYLGIELAEPPNLLQLKSQLHHANHLGTIHASVLIALAEAASGLFLINHLSDYQPDALARENSAVSQPSLTRASGWYAGDNIFPVIRRIDAKFHQGAQGTIYARCTLDPNELSAVHTDLQQKRRARVQVPMQVIDASETLLLSVTYDWFITINPSRTD